MEKAITGVELLVIWSTNKYFRSIYLFTYYCFFFLLFLFRFVFLRVFFMKRRHFYFIPLFFLCVQRGVQLLAHNWTTYIYIGCMHTTPNAINSSWNDVYRDTWHELSAEKAYVRAIYCLSHGNCFSPVIRPSICLYWHCFFPVELCWWPCHQLTSF